MPIFLYKFFHRKTNDKTEGGVIKIPQDDSLWPDSWKKIETKEYSFYKPISLFDHSDSQLFQLLKARNSNEKKLLENKINLPIISYLLKMSYGGTYVDNFLHRTVPSGGARYPLEIYLFIFKDLEDIKAGIYHYNVTKHLLEIVKIKSFSEEELLRSQTYKWTTLAHGMICVTGLFDRTVRKYGSRGYRYVLLEAGHVAQNILIAGTEKQLSLRPMESTVEAVIEGELGLSENIENLIYSIYF